VPRLTSSSGQAHRHSAASQPLEGKFGPSIPSHPDYPVPHLTAARPGRRVPWRPHAQVQDSPSLRTEQYRKRRTPTTHDPLTARWHRRGRFDPPSQAPDPRGNPAQRHAGRTHQQPLTPTSILTASPNALFVRRGACPTARPRQATVEHPACRYIRALRPGAGVAALESCPSNAHRLAKTAPGTQSSAHHRRDPFTHPPHLPSRSASLPHPRACLSLSETIGW